MLSSAADRRMLAAMSEPHAVSRMLTQRRELGRLTPRRFTQTARWRFNADRRGSYLRRIGGPPDERQALIIAQMVSAEWQALVCEHNAAKAAEADAEAATKALRLAAEFRRQLMLLDRDLAATMRKPRERARAKPGVPQLDLEQHMAKLRGRREGVA
jgi:hypothetical protein